MDGFRLELPGLCIRSFHFQQLINKLWTWLTPVSWVGALLLKGNPGSTTDNVRAKLSTSSDTFFLEPVI